MPNGMYAKGRQAYLSGQADWDTATYKVVAVDTGTYTPNLATHEFLSDIPLAARIATTPALTGKTVTDGVADADNTQFAAVPAGPDIEALVIVQTSAASGGADLAADAQRLVLYIDTATGLPMTPNGGPLNVTWDEGPNKIFKL